MKKKTLFHFTLVYANPDGNDRLSKLMTGQLKLNNILDRVDLRPLVWAVLIFFKYHDSEVRLKRGLFIRFLRHPPNLGFRVNGHLIREVRMSLFWH